MKKKLITIICMILIVSMMTGCTTFTNFKNAFFAGELMQNETIKIGVFEPLSGENKEKGKLELMGIELAHEMNQIGYIVIGLGVLLGGIVIFLLDLFIDKNITTTKISKNKILYVS